jgi:hypothetical protein
MRGAFLAATVIMIAASVVNVIGSLYVDQIFFYVIYQVVLIPCVMVLFLSCGIRVLIKFQKKPLNKDGNMHRVSSRIVLDMSTLYHSSSATVYNMFRLLSNYSL